jgi:hypothetical protein
VKVPDEIDIQRARVLESFAAASAIRHGLGSSSTIWSVSSSRSDGGRHLK